MKQIQLTFLFAVLMSMVGTRALAYAIAVKNADGVTIYYNYINNKTELQVTNDNVSYTHYSGSVNIPESVTYMNQSYSVTSIANDAFSGCNKLTSVTIPNSVKIIGSWAFSYCTSLTSVSIPNGVTNIGNAAFAGCTGLTSVMIPNSVTSIGNAPFYGCSGLTSVELHCSEIGSWFSGFSIKQVLLGNEVTSIGDYAFAKCRALTSVTIPNNVTSIGIYAFSECSGLTSVELHCSEIGSWFSSCPLEQVFLGNEVKSIGNQAFAKYSSLTSVTIGNGLTNIGDSAFYYCRKLTSMNIPNSVKKIGNEAFCDCSGLTSVTIGNCVTNIGFKAFCRCIHLNTITSLPVTPPTCGHSCFYNVKKSTCQLVVPEGSVDAYKAADQWKDFSNIADTASGIENIKCETKTINRYYTLDGCEVEHPTKGIYIVNGKKVIIK